MKTCAILLVMLASFAAAQSQALQDVQSALQRKDYATALRAVRPLAQGGDPNAQFILGTMYAVGLGVARSNSDAVNWFRKAAEQGHPVAQSNLGVAYLSGNVTRTNRRTGEVLVKPFVDADMRFMQGVYRGADGKPRQGTFGFA